MLSRSSPTVSPASPNDDPGQMAGRGRRRRHVASPKIVTDDDASAGAPSAALQVHPGLAGPAPVRALAEAGAGRPAPGPLPPLRQGLLGGPRRPPRRAGPLEGQTARRPRGRRPRPVEAPRPQQKGTITRFPMRQA